MFYDQGSITGQNIVKIASDSGLDKFKVIQFSPRGVADLLVLHPIPEGSEWKVGFLKELIKIRSGELTLHNESLSPEEIEDLIVVISTN